MTQALHDDEDDGERARLDGRIAFATASLVAAMCFAAVLDRVGAPISFVEAVAPCFVAAGFGLLGVLLRSMRVSYYYAAGRAVPTEYAAFALAALTAGLICAFAPQFAARSWFFGVCGGVLAGAALAGIWVGPLLRKSGAFSLAGLLVLRFPGLAARLAALGFAGLCAALLAVAGETAAVDALAGVFNGSRIFPALLVALVALSIAAPGGLFSALWSACGAGAIAILGFGWPLATLVLRGAPVFERDAVWREVAGHLERWGALDAFDGYGAGAIAALATTLGVATLAPLLAPAVATRDAARARAAGMMAFGWSLLFAWLVAMSVASAALSLSRQTVGQAPQRLPDAVYELSRRGVLTLCGADAATPVAARAACGPQKLTLADEDVAARPGLLLTALPTLEHMSAAAAGLAAAARLALALALAAAGLQAFGTTLGHETVYRFRGETDLTSRRLATTRLALVGVSALGFASSAFDFAPAGDLAALAITLSAALIAPSAILALWSRASDRDALAAMLCGLLGVGAVIAAAGAAHGSDVLGSAGLFGAAFGLVGGIASALQRGDESEPGAAFAARLLHGDGEVVGPDKGA